MMARVTHVKKAQQRYKMVPVLNEDGSPKITPVLKGDGTPKTTKTGRAITRRVTQEDRNQPLPELSCDFPGCTINGGKIAIGSPYKWVAVKQQYGAIRHNRHADHPSWEPWELSNSLSAQIARVISEAEEATSGADNPDDIKEALSNAAEGIRDLASQKREGADNIRDGFGHDTPMSEELDGVADELESWADEIEDADIPDLPDPEDADEDERDDCDACSGTGHDQTKDAEDDDQCQECSGTGKAEVGDEPTEGQMENWRSQVEDALNVLGNSPY